MDALYHEGQRKFSKKDYKAALPIFETYIEISVQRKHRSQRLFWVVDQIGRIHLKVERKPEKAISFFEKMLKQGDWLSDAEKDDIRAWIIAAKDWQKNFYPAKSAKEEKKSFEKGKAFFLKGKRKLKSANGDAGNTDFTLASMYLIPFIHNNNSSPNIGEALLTMGEIRHYLRTDPEYWNDNFYLRETIRRFPHTPLATEAYSLIEKDIKYGYSDQNVPPSIKQMLKSFKRLSTLKKK